MHILELDGAMKESEDDRDEEETAWWKCLTNDTKCSGVLSFRDTKLFMVHNCVIPCIESVAQFKVKW